MVTLRLNAEYCTIYFHCSTFQRLHYILHRIKLAKENPKPFTIPLSGKRTEYNIPCRFLRILFARWISFLHSDIFSWADVMFSSTL